MVDRTITEDMAALIKGMLLRGDDQSDIAAFFLVNGGRISEINTGKRFQEVKPATPKHLPPPVTKCRKPRMKFLMVGHVATGFRLYGPLPKDWIKRDIAHIEEQCTQNAGEFCAYVEALPINDAEK